jgi:hypothetical protein
VALEQAGGLEVAQHGVQRALLAGEHAVAHLFQPLGDLVAIHRFRRASEHRQER